MRATLSEDNHQDCNRMSCLHEIVGSFLLPKSKINTLTLNEKE